MDRGAWRATVHRVTKSRTRLKQLSTHTLGRGMGWRMFGEFNPTSELQNASHDWKRSSRAGVVLWLFTQVHPHATRHACNLLPCQPNFSFLPLLPLEIQGWNRVRWGDNLERTIGWLLTHWLDLSQGWLITHWFPCLWNVKYSFLFYFEFMGLLIKFKN